MAAKQLQLRNDQSPTVLEKLKSDILKGLSQGDVSIESSELETVGFPLMQLLVAAQFEASACSANLRIAVPSGGCLDQALDSFGLREAVPLRPVIEDDAWTGLIRIGAPK
jgi:hypothetical protein